MQLGYCPLGAKYKNERKPHTKVTSKKCPFTDIVEMNTLRDVLYANGNLGGATRKGKGVGCAL